MGAITHVSVRSIASTGPGAAQARALYDDAPDRGHDRAREPRPRRRRVQRLPAQADPAAVTLVTWSQA